MVNRASIDKPLLPCPCSPSAAPRARRATFTTSGKSTPRLLAAGCWLLAAGCWLLAAGCWLLAARRRALQPGVVRACWGSVQRALTPPATACAGSGSASPRATPRPPAAAGARSRSPSPRRCRGSRPAASTRTSCRPGWRCAGRQRTLFPAFFAKGQWPPCCGASASSSAPLEGGAPATAAPPPSRRPRSTEPWQRTA
jgi:hypothetical protein